MTKSVRVLFAGAVLAAAAAWAGCKRPAGQPAESTIPSMAASSLAKPSRTPAVATDATSATDAPGTWTKKAPMPVAADELGAAAIDGKVYAIGGATDQDWGGTTLALSYDPARNTWQTIAPLPKALSHVGVAALGGKLYAIGGFTRWVHLDPQDLAFVYDPRTDKWSVLPKLSSAKGSVAVVAVDGKLHAFGGRRSERVVKTSPPGAPDVFAGFGTVADHDIYDPDAGKWSTGAPVPGPPRDHMGIAVLEGRVHLFGGRTANRTDTLDRHDVYDPKTDRWTTAAPLPQPRSAGAYTVLKGRILYAGGECKPGGEGSTSNAYDEVTAYDAKSDAWTSLAPLPHARHGFGAATVNEVAYFMGGAPVCGGGAIGALSETLALTIP